MNLRQAKKKRIGPHIKAQQPFPIWIESESDYSVNRDFWPTFIGTFTGDCVVVCNTEEMKTLYTMGFFGKGSYSRGYPSFGLTKKGIPPIIKERQWERRKAWMENIQTDYTNSLNTKDTENKTDQKSLQEDGSKGTSIENDMEVESDKPLEPSVSRPTDELTAPDSDGYEVLVLADSDSEDIEKVLRDPRPHLESQPIDVVAETLILTLEEAFFLSYALGCLQVTDLLGNPLDLKELWLGFSKVKADFVESYVAYHYFRAKGWVVKSGFKFGGDFLLYKQGPPFYHASYIVVVEKVDCRLKRFKESLTWTKLHGLSRLAESSGKDIITCQVVVPDDLTPADCETPASLARYQVNEQLVKRWISSQERIEKE